MGMIKEFREFAVKGNVIDMAVGIIIGAAFGKIVTSLVNDIIMPPIGKALGNVNFRDLFVNLDRAKVLPDGTVPTSLDQARTAGAAVIAYGQFINVIIDFVIVAFCIFLMVKAINRMKRQAPPPPPPEANTRECPQCLSVIPKRATRCAHCTAQVPAAA